MIAERTDSGFVIQNIVVNCANIDAALEKLYKDEQFNPGLIAFSQEDHDVILEEVKAHHAKEGHVMNTRANPKLGGFENQTTGEFMHVRIIPGLPRGTVRLYKFR